MPVVFKVGRGKTGLRTMPVSCFRRVLSFAEYTEEGGEGQVFEVCMFRVFVQAL